MFILFLSAWERERQFRELVHFLGDEAAPQGHKPSLEEAAKGKRRAEGLRDKERQ